MVAEHRRGGRRLVFDADDEPDEPAGAAGDAHAADSGWGERLRRALAAAGIDLPRAGRGVGGLEVAPGVLGAVVVDDDGEHRVRVGLRVLPDEVWDDAAETLAGDAWAAAALARGRVPDALEAAVAAAGAELLPTSSAALPMDCTCADWAMPCRHVAATLAAAAERFAADASALVRWRGRERRVLRDEVRDRRAARGPASADAELLARWHRAGAPLPGPAGRPTRPDALVDELPPLGADLDPVDATGRRVDAREALRGLYRRLAAGEGGVENG